MSGAEHNVTGARPNDDDIVVSPLVEYEQLSIDDAAAAMVAGVRRDLEDRR